MAKPKVFVARRMAQEALDMIADAAEMELWERVKCPPTVLIQKHCRRRANNFKEG